MCPLITIGFRSASGEVSSNSHIFFKYFYAIIHAYKLMRLANNLTWRLVSFHLLTGIDTADNSISYGWWSMTVAILAVIRYGFIKKLKGFNFTLIPRPKDVLFMSLGTLLILALSAPWIFAFGLFEIKKHVKIQLLAPLTYALENFLTTAITDEGKYHHSSIPIVYWRSIA